MTHPDLNHDLTPRMSPHARARALEMGIRTQIAKAIYRRPSLVWPCRPRPCQEPGTKRFHVTSDLFPGLGIVVTADRDGHPIIVTILYWHGDGKGFTRTEHHDREEHHP